MLAMKSRTCCLDRSFSHAFAREAFKKGFATPSEYLQSNKKVLNALIDNRISIKLQSIALEMAVLFDEVILFGFGDEFDFSTLEKRGIIRGVVSPGATYKEDMPPTGSFIHEIKNDVFPTIHRRSNLIVRALGKEGVEKPFVSDTYDVVIRAAGEGIVLREFSAAVTSMLGNLDFPIPIYEDTMWVAKKFILRAYDDFKIVPMVALTVLQEIMNEVNTLWNGLLLSYHLASPFLTRRISTVMCSENRVDIPEHEAFVLCQMSMRDIIGYAPVVENIDDVFRLRENKYIMQFRGVLDHWCKELSQGHTHLREKIEKDIRLASEDLRKLEKWRRVDNWLFWVEIIASMVPGLNLIVAGELILRRLYSNSLKRRSGWLAISR